MSEPDVSRLRHLRRLLLRFRSDHAHDQAVRTAVSFLEQHACFSRTGKGGIFQIDGTRFAAAGFVHRTSRARDPQLHTHVLVANKAQGVDGRWRSLDGRELYVMQKPGGTSTVLRERGLEETVARELPGVSIVARQYGMADPARSRAAAENILTAHPDLAGLFASSEAASLGSIQAIRSRGLSGKIKLVTFDSSETHVAALKDGTIDIMLVQDPFRIGYEAVNRSRRSLAAALPQGAWTCPRM